MPLSARQAVEVFHLVFLRALPNQLELYEDASAWDAMQSAVVTQLEALQ